MKRYISSFAKTIFWRYYLHYKHGKHNKLGKRVILSKDLICEQECNIGNNTILGQKVKIGSKVKIGRDCIIENLTIDDFSCIEGRVVCTGFGKGHISIGKHCYIGVYNVLDWSDNIVIGDYVHIAGPSTGLWTHSSAQMCLNSVPLDDKQVEIRPTAPIHIQSNVYIGGNCTIYPGIEIGHHSIIAPNSVVTKDVQPWSMVGGVPAKFIKSVKLGLR